jgi:hypothetical protein
MAGSGGSQGFLSMAVQVNYSASNVQVLSWDAKFCVHGIWECGDGTNQIDPHRPSCR